MDNDMLPVSNHASVVAGVGTEVVSAGVTTSTVGDIVFSVPPTIGVLPKLGASVITAAALGAGVTTAAAVGGGDGAGVSSIGKLMGKDMRVS